MSATSGNFESTYNKSADQCLHRQRAGSVLTGVCSGIAATFDLDVSLVRITCVIGSLVSPWVSIAYLALAFTLPSDDRSTDTEARPFFDGSRVIDEIKCSARAVIRASLQNNQKAFRRTWREQIANVCRAWSAAIRC